MQKKIRINFTNRAVILVPDSNTQISSFFDYAITVPAVATESSGTSIQKFAQILESDFVTHIHDLHIAPITIMINWTSGTSLQFTIYAEKRGKSENGMSSWYVCASNGWEVRIAEGVLQSVADLNQCVEPLAIKAAGENFILGTKDSAIQKSIKTLRCLNKN
ncbi:MAG: hypothetical protein HY764_02320 [Candidatus Portnoybacteria bacterium]|nr:hypothetical protein [Candidatus Portnoybacteria bacterium]